MLRSRSIIRSRSLIRSGALIHSRPGFRSFLVFLLAGLGPLGLASAQTDAHGGHGSSEPPADSLPEVFSDPMPHLPAALGDFSHAVTTSSPEAQTFFDQGFQLMMAFGKYEAVRSFREAWRRDPGCAMCYWGEAWAWGSYLNVPMAEWEAPHAYAAVQKALALRDNASPRERDYIDALSARYVSDFDGEKRRKQDEAYAEAMQALAEKYRDDLDAATLYADALFLLIPRRGFRDIDNPDVARIAGVLESVLAEDIGHPGACHLYVHLTEATTEPGRADACAEHLGDSIPGASHINHMPAHTWNEIGRWGDSVRANLQAWHSDQKAEIGEGVAIYAPHNLHMLLYAASYDGQGAVAMQAARDYSKLTGDGAYRSLTLLRFGRFEELLEVSEPPPVSDFSAGMTTFAHGYALLRTGQADGARFYHSRLENLSESTDATHRFDPVERLLNVVKEILGGELYSNAGDREAAIEAFERAVEHEDALEYDEPEPLPFSARHWLGAALLEAERFAEAEQVYREELADHPRNGWSLFGLKAALEAQGKPTSDVERELDESWARADIWLRASRL